MLLPKRSNHRLRRALLLAVLLVLAQQWAAVHWLHHALESLRPVATHQSAGDHCEVCDQLAGFSAMLPSDAAPLLAAGIDGSNDAAVGLAEGPTAAPAAAYQPRAPPLIG